MDNKSIIKFFRVNKGVKISQSTWVKAWFGGTKRTVMDTTFLVLLLVIQIVIN